MAKKTKSKTTKKTTSKKVVKTDEAVPDWAADVEVLPDGESGADQLTPSPSPSPSTGTPSTFAGYSIPMAMSLFPQAFAEVFGVPANVLSTQFKEACYHVIKRGECVPSPARKMFSGLLEGGYPSAGGNIPNALELRLRRALLVADVMEELTEKVTNE